jgi:hypothetical protein
MRLGNLKAAAIAIPRLHALSQDATLPYLRIEAMLLEFRLRSLQPDSPELASLLEEVRTFGQSDASVAMTPTFKATALLAIAEARLRQGDAADAQRWVGQALEKLGGAGGKGVGMRISAIGQMLSGIALLQSGRAEAALQRLQSSQAGLVAAFGSEHPTALLFGLNTALALAELHRVPDAIAIVRHAEPILRDALGEDAPSYREVQALLQRLESAPPANPLPPGRGFFS